jgi:hypothetical protein
MLILISALPAAATAPTVNGMALTSDGIGGVGVPTSTCVVVVDVEPSFEQDNNVAIDNKTREIAFLDFISALLCCEDYCFTDGRNRPATMGGAKMMLRINSAINR